MGSRTLDVQLDSLLAALHAQVGWGPREGWEHAGRCLLRVREQEAGLKRRLPSAGARAARHSTAPPCRGWSGQPAGQGQLWGHLHWLCVPRARAQVETPSRGLDGSDGERASRRLRSRAHPAPPGQMRGMEVTGSSGGTLRPGDFLSGREEGRKTRESVGRRLCEKEEQGEWTYFLAPRLPGHLWACSTPTPAGMPAWPAGLSPHLPHTDGALRGPGVGLW